MNKKYIQNKSIMQIGNTAILAEDDYIYQFNTSNIKKFSKFKIFKNDKYTVIYSSLSRADLYKSMLMIDRNIELINEFRYATSNNDMLL